MKKPYTVAAVLLVMLTVSCKKQYQCVCKFSNGTVQSSTTIKAYSKTLAEVQCTDKGSGYSCAIE